MAVETRAAPYAPLTNVVSLFRRFRERGLPDVLTSQELQRLGIPAGSTGRTLQALKFLGLVDDDGRRTPRFDALRLASDADYPAALADVVRTAYAEVLTYVDPATATETELRDAFRPYTPATQTARMIVLFIGLAREAGMMPDAGSGRDVTPRTRRSGTVTRTRASRNQYDAAKDDVPLPVAAPDSKLADYRVLDALFQQLPRDGRWSESRRNRWLQAVTASLDLLVEIVETEVERSQVSQFAAAASQAGSSD